MNPNLVSSEEEMPAHLKQSSILVKLVKIPSHLSLPKQNLPDLGNLFTDLNPISALQGSALPEFFPPSFRHQECFHPLAS